MQSSAVYALDSIQRLVAHVKSRLISETKLHQIVLTEFHFCPNEYNMIIYYD